MGLQMPHKIHPGIIRRIIDEIKVKVLEIRNFEINSVEMVELITLPSIKRLKLVEGNFANVKIVGDQIKIKDLRKDKTELYKLPKFAEA